MKDKAPRPWLSAIACGASLVSHAGAALLVETARRGGLAGQLPRRLDQCGSGHRPGTGLEPAGAPVQDGLNRDPPFS